MARARASSAAGAGSARVASAVAFCVFARNGARLRPLLMADALPQTLDESSEAPVAGGRLAGGWFVAIVIITLGRAVAVALLPPLLLEAPALLILISPAAADLVIAAPLLPAWLYFSAAMVGALVQTAIAYNFGQALGERALVWLQSRSAGAKRSTTRILGWLERGTVAVILATPGLTVSALAGVSGVPPRRFYPLLVLGNLLWTVGCFVFGAALTDQLELLYAFVGKYAPELTVGAASIVVIQFVWSKLRQRRARRD